MIYSFRIISYIFHPVFIPVYILGYMFLSPGILPVLIPPYYMLMLTGMVILITIIFPLVIIFLMYRQGIITSFLLKKREERIYPLLIIMVFYYLTFFVMKGLPVFSAFSRYMLGAAIIAILLLVVQFFHKASLHMAAMGGSTGFLLGTMLVSRIDILIPLLTCILVSGVIGTSRMVAGDHKPSEIYSGFLAGIGVMAVLMLIW